jgi:hypothetical protein
MVKGVDRSAHLVEARLEVKEGGRSGRWTGADFEDPWA